MWQSGDAWPNLVGSWLSCVFFLPCTGPEIECHSFLCPSNYAHGVWIVSLGPGCWPQRSSIWEFTRINNCLLRLASWSWRSQQCCEASTRRICGWFQCGQNPCTCTIYFLQKSSTSRPYCRLVMIFSNCKVSKVCSFSFFEEKTMPGVLTWLLDPGQRSFRRGDCTWSLGFYACSWRRLWWQIYTKFSSVLHER